MGHSLLRRLWLMGLLASSGALAQGLDDPIPESIDPGDVEVRLVEVASGFVSPLHGTAPPGDSNRLFVVDQVGIVYAVDLASGASTVFMDVSDRLTIIPGAYDERGLLGLAFDPAYGDNGYLYTYTSEPTAGLSDFPWNGNIDHQTVIARWRVPNPLDSASVVDLTSRAELLRIDQPTRFHQGGTLAFDGAGMLLISLGNGGPLDTGQDNSNPLGSILRIDPAGSNSANGAYGIPADNPFVGETGVVEEILASGFRNPFRISVDSETGDIWGTDVGNNDIEEVNQVRPGENYGFNIKEGSFCFIGGSGPPSGAPGVADPSTCDSTGLTDPLAEYDHDEGIAIIGGYLYRGEQIPELQGHYVFGDFSRTFSEPAGRLFYLEGSTILELRLPRGESLGKYMIGLGRDGSGEIYALVNDVGRPSGTSGAIYRIAPSDAAPSDSIEIDYRPWSDVNKIAPTRWRRYVAVAALTTSEAQGDTSNFDALQIDPGTARFGPGGTPWSRDGAWPSWTYVRDVDRDGDSDLLMYFLTGWTGIACGDTTAELRAETWSGSIVSGADRIVTVRCPEL